MELNIFESFAGVGSQYKALELLKKENETLNLNVVGIAEWDVNSLIAYHRIHRSEKVKDDRKKILNNLFNLEEKKENLKIIKEKVVSYLEDKMKNGWCFSNDTKKPLNINSIKKMNYEKLIQFFVASEYYNNISTVTNLRNSDYLKNLSNIDIFTYSFPCQAISLQGKREGLEENSNTSSSLLWQIKYFLEEINKKAMSKKKKNDNSIYKLPEFLLMENVAALFNQKNSVEWNRFKLFLENIGYETYEIVLKASYFGIPQNRDRAFGLSIKKDNPNREKIKEKFLLLTNKKTINTTIDDFLDKSLTKEDIEKLKIKEEFQVQKEKFKKSHITKNHICKIELKNYTTFATENAVYHSKNGVSATITAQGAQSRIKIYDVDNDVIRYMTAKEHLKLMGFEEKDYVALVSKYNLTNEKEHVISEIMIKKMMGNSIVVNVLKEIFKILIDEKS